jgi:DNA-directed RNA polymerase specialized sigma24 family protein
MSTPTRPRTVLAEGEAYQGTPERILAEIMGAYQQRVTGFIAGRLGYRDRQLAEDLTQETFIRLWRFYVAPGVPVDGRVFALLTVIGRQTISQHYLRRHNHERVTDFTDAEVPAARTLAGPLAEMPHLARLYTELEQAKDALVPVARAYQSAKREAGLATGTLRSARTPEGITRATARHQRATDALRAALDAFRSAGDLVAERRQAWNEAATTLGNSHNDPVIPKLPAPRKPTPDSAAVDHPGDSDPNPDEALRRARIGAGR